MSGPQVMVVEALQAPPPRRSDRVPPGRPPLTRQMVELRRDLYLPGPRARAVTPLWNEGLDGSASQTTSPAAIAVERLKNAKRIDGEGLPADCGDCPICLETFSCGKVVIEMQCSHLFHEGCVCRWLEGHDTCPTCRGRV